MNKWGILIISIILIILGISGIVYWFNDFLIVLKGSIGAISTLLGVLMLIIAIEEFRY